MFALMWLTISTPFVFSHYQQVQMIESSSEAEEDIPDPFASTTEEKTESSVNTLSEFLHEFHHAFADDNALLKHGKCHEMDIYVAFHGELISPPPEA